ncbi:MAG: Do family serine endopeptidase [Bacteroidales bacterium]
MRKTNFSALVITIALSAVTAFLVTNWRVAPVGSNSTTSSNYFYEESGKLYKEASFNRADFPDFTYAAEHAVKAVVHVKVVKRGKSAPYSIFDFFFGYEPQIPREQVGAGSGVIITNDGYIVTNNHVIEGADQIEVTLENNRTFKATLVGSDPATDVALLKIEAENLPILKFGDSDALKLGEWVLAIGNPLNLRSTVTAGIVSAKARTIQPVGNKFRIEAFIQTDAAVNSGNSGGALVNIAGELVGINTAIASRTGDFSGYSFAVPTTIVKKIVSDIIDFGSVQRAFLGISMRDIDDSLARETKLKEAKGVYIEEVISGSAAEKGGVKRGDVLLAIDGTKINSSPEVQEQVNKYRPGEKIEIDIYRGGKERKLSVVLTGREDQIAMSGSGDDATLQLYGAQLKNSSESTLKKLKLKGGVELVSVNDGKFKDSGMREGFIITYVNQVPVMNILELQAVISKSQRALLIEGLYPNGKVAYYAVGI